MFEKELIEALQLIVDKYESDNLCDYFEYEDRFVSPELVKAIEVIKKHLPTKFN